MAKELVAALAAQPSMPFGRLYLNDCHVILDSSSARSLRKSPCMIRPLATIDFPEESSLLALGWAPDDIRSVVISHPANYHVIPGGVNISHIKLSSYVVDPIYYGFRRAFRSTTVFFHFKK